MTVDEARNLLLEWTRGLATPYSPLIWVSELLGEDETDYYFNSAVYANGEKTEEVSIKVAVDKCTGEVNIRIPIG